MAYGTHRLIEFHDCSTGNNVEIDFGEEQESLFDVDKYYLIDGKCYRKLDTYSKAHIGEYELHDVEGPFTDCNCTNSKMCYAPLFECSTQSEGRMQMTKEQYEQLEQGRFYRIDGNCYQVLVAHPNYINADAPEHVIEGPFDDCECVAPEPVEPTIKKRIGDVEYYEKVNCEFADAVYNKAMAERYGVEFCCEKDLQRLTIKKKLLDAGALQDDIDLCLL